MAKRLLGKSSYFVYKRKEKSIGEVKRHKARLVVLGYQQAEGLRFDEKMSSTRTESCDRMFSATAAVEDLERRHMDVVQAFTRAPITKQLYTEIPENHQNFPGAVRILKKGLYGTVQEARC